jgi:hypothetical protein
MMSDDGHPATARIAGLKAMGALLTRGTYEYRGQEQQLAIEPDDTETSNRLLDVFGYYMDHAFVASLEGAKVLAVEQKVECELAPGIMFSGIIDLILNRGDVWEVWDHKSTGDVNGSLAFLGLDVQMLSYEVIVNEYIRKKLLREETVELIYNLVRRERPPGYGSRPLTTKSGAKSTASTNPKDYLHQHRFAHTAPELECVAEDLRRKAYDAANWLNVGPHDLTGKFAERRPIKTGGESCRTGCGFFAQCCAELLGHSMPTFAPSTIEEAD